METGDKTRTRGWTSTVVGNRCPKPAIARRPPDVKRIRCRIPRRPNPRKKLSRRAVSQKLPSNSSRSRIVVGEHNRDYRSYHPQQKPEENVLDVFKAQSEA